MKPLWRVSAEPRRLPSVAVGARRGPEVKRREPWPRRGAGPGTLPPRGDTRALSSPGRPGPGAGGARPLGRCCPG